MTVEGVFDHIGTSSSITTKRDAGGGA